MGSYKSRPMNQIVSDQWNKKLSENYEHLHSRISDELNAVPDTGWSMLHIACCEDELDPVLELLHTHSVYQPTQPEHLTPLHIACINARYKIVKVLLEQSADVTVLSLHGFSPVHIAASKGDCILLSQLLSTDIKQVNVRCQYGGLSPLHIASFKGHSNAVEYLLNHGADPELRDLIDFSPLHIACYFGHTEVVEALLTHGADINVEGQINDTPLHVSCSRGHTGLSLLLINMFNPNILATDNERQLSLHIAARLGMVSVIDALLNSDKNITPHALNIYKDTPLHIACYSGQLGATKRLLKASEDSLSIENIFSETPFHSACTNGTNIDLIKLLLDSPKVDINMQGRDGHTGLHSACYHGHEEVVQFLLENGANAHLMARGQESDQLYDESCLMWAYEKGYDEVITILKRKARPPMEENGSVGDYSPSSSDSSDLYQVAVPSPIGKIRSMTKEKADIMQLRETLEITLKYQIKLSEIEILEPVGSGSFGKVYKGRWLGKQVAIKKYRVSSLSCKSDIDLFCREVSILCEVSHPNVIKFVGACLDEPSQFAILTHFAEGGSLYALLHEQKRVLDIPIKYGIAIDVARGMAYLHQLPTPIMHRDLNSHNILLDQDGKGLIADFGESTFLKSPEEENLTKQPGNLRWMAPEIFTQSTRYSIEADMFSFSLCLWEIFTGELPLQERKPAQAAYDMSYMNVRPTVPLIFPRPLTQLIQTGWALSPEERPTFQQAYETLTNIASGLQTNSSNSTSRSTHSSPYLTSRRKFEDNNSNLDLDAVTISRASNESAYVTDPLSTKRISSTN